MTFAIPKSATAYGFVADGLGSHSSRTMMLRELRLLLAACPPGTEQADYRTAIISENVLLKTTAATRVKSFRHLHELYALDLSRLLFRALCQLWDHAPAAQPVLALLCALARDPALRSTAPVILAASAGDPITPNQLAGAAHDHFAARLSAATLAKIGRNAASSWQQSGHLAGHRHKIRARVQSDPVATAYALFLGYLCDERGDGLFDTLWTRLLDAPVHLLHQHAQAASRQGWLEYRHTGDVTEITFRYLLRKDDHVRD